MDKNRYWYFVTQMEYGDEVVLKPRHIENASDSEPDFKRICVAPTAAHCMSAIGLYVGELNIYRTKRKCMGIKSHDVPDSRMTKEHWRRRKTTFVRVARLTIPNALWLWGDRGIPPGGYGWERQVKDKRLIIEWLKRQGDSRLYTIRDANQPWRIESDTR